MPAFRNRSHPIYKTMVCLNVAKVCRVKFMCAKIYFPLPQLIKREGPDSGLSFFNLWKEKEENIGKMS